MDYQKLLETTEQILILRGGRGSGNWGHAGRKGKKGGSGKGGGLAAIGAKPGSSHEERQKASKTTKVKREKKAAKERLLKDIGGLEDFSRDELLTLRSRIDNLLGESKEANGRLAGEKPGITNGHTVTVLGTDPSKKFDMRYEIRELDDLITSNNDSGSINPAFPKELQPRDRTRVASQRQIDSIAANLEPEALLGEFKAIDRGTPIIGDDNAVESGNGRSMALRRARDQHPEQFQKYQDELRKTAQDKGIDPTTLDQFNNPVLVRRRLTNVDRVEFAKEANTASILGASDTERARSDASRVSSEHLQNLSMRDSIDDTIRAPSNRDFVRNFVGNTPEVERATMVDRNGNLTKSGENRIKGAMFNRVYDSPELSDRIFESTDNDIKNVTNGIMNSLGPMSKAEELVRTGQRNKDLSIAGDIAKTVQVYSSLKDRNLSVKDFLSQGALFGRELNPTQEKILVEIDNRRRSGKQMTELFTGWSSLIEQEPHPAQGSLFGGAGRSKDQLVDDWIKRANQGPQPGLFTIQGLIETAEDIIIWRGGPTSGNWGHAGRKGKRGGSGRGGGFSRIGVKPGASRKEIKRETQFTREKRTVTADTIESFLTKRRRDLESDNPLKKALGAKIGDDEDAVLMYADVMMMSRDNFDKYAKKLGLENIDSLADQTFSQFGDNIIDRKIAKLRYELRQKNTLPEGGARSTFDDLDKSSLIGKNSKEVIDIVRNKFGVRVLADEGVSQDRVHSDLSRLIRSGDQFAPVSQTLNDKVKTIRFRDKGKYPGYTAVANFEIDTINIFTSNYGETNTYTWVHEIGHGAEEYFSFKDLHATFDKGKRPTMYAWGNSSENFAETFTMIVGGGQRGSAVKKGMKEQYDFITKGVKGFE